MRQTGQTSNQQSVVLMQQLGGVKRNKKQPDQLMVSLGGEKKKSAKRTTNTVTRIDATSRWSFKQTNKQKTNKQKTARSVDDFIMQKNERNGFVVLTKQKSITI